MRAHGQRPTILQLIPKLESGGAERTVVEICAAIAQAGGRALVAAEDGRMAADVRAAGGEIIPLPMASKNPLQIIANARRLTTLIKTERVDLVHARSRAPAWSALMAARQTRIPFVTTFHGAYSERGRVKRLYNSVMARADRVIANSNFTAGVIRSRYGTALARITVIHRGIDPAAYDSAAITPARLDALRTAWGITSETRVVLVAARLTPPKGQTIVIDAAGRLGLAFSGGAAAAAPVAIILAGDAQGRDEYARELDRRIAAHRLEGVVKRVGHVSDMPAAYALAHIALMPSTYPEAFGRASIEAQASGVPVIATRIGAPPESVRAAPDWPETDATGWLVPPGDADALAGALAEAFALSPSAYAEMAARARANAAANFTLAALQDKTLTVYDELLGTKLAATFRENLGKEILRSDRTA
jgi:glycosyltransferase involved in cell wall biosynthesis